MDINYVVFQGMGLYVLSSWNDGLSVADSDPRLAVPRAGVLEDETTEMQTLVLHLGPQD
jgi:hypothetical protein